jgi:hypothetical protein
MHGDPGLAIIEFGGAVTVMVFLFVGAPALERFLRPALRVRPPTPAELEFIARRDRGTDATPLQKLAWGGASYASRALSVFMLLSGMSFIALSLLLAIGRAALRVSRFEFFATWGAMAAIFGATLLATAILTTALRILPRPAMPPRRRHKTQQESGDWTEDLFDPWLDQ